MTLELFFGFCLGTFIGGFLLKQGGYRLFLLFKLKKKGVFVEGLVIRFDKGDAWGTTVPVIRFSDSNGREFEGIPKNAVPSKDIQFHSTGDILKVYYDANDPEQFVTDTISNQLICWLVTIAGGLFLFVVVMVLFRDLAK